MSYKANYSEDNVDWIFFDETKYARLASNHYYHFNKDELMPVLEELNRKPKISVGYYSIKDISDFLFFRKPLSEYIKQDNVGIMTLPITRYNDSVYSISDYSWYDFLKIIRSGDTFLLYQFIMKKGKLIVKGKKI